MDSAGKCDGSREQSSRGNRPHQVGGLRDRLAKPKCRKEHGRTYRQPLNYQKKNKVSQYARNNPEKGLQKSTWLGKVKTHLSVIGFAGRKERLKRVVTGDQETSKVDEELASNVEEDKEEVDADQTQDRIDLGDVGLALQVVEDGVFGELYGFLMVSKLHSLDFSCQKSSFCSEKKQ